MDFEERLDHGDGAVLRAQAWLADHSSAPNPVEAMTKQSGLTERSFDPFVRVGEIRRRGFV